MLAQNHAAGAYHACNDDDQTEPPYRIEVEIFGKGYEGSAHTTDGCRVGGNLPPDVDERTDDLHG